MVKNVERLSRERVLIQDTGNFVTKSKGNSLNAHSADRNFVESSIFKDILGMYTVTMMASYATNALR